MALENNSDLEETTEPAYPRAKTYFLGCYVTFAIIVLPIGLLLAIPFLWINRIEIGSGRRAQAMGANGKMVLSIIFAVVGLWSVMKALLQ